MTATKFDQVEEARRILDALISQTNNMMLISRDLEDDWTCKHGDPVGFLRGVAQDMKRTVDEIEQLIVDVRGRLS